MHNWLGCAQSFPCQRFTTFSSFNCDGKKRATLYPLLEVTVTSPVLPMNCLSLIHSSKKKKKKKSRQLKTSEPILSADKWRKLIKVSRHRDQTLLSWMLISVAMICFCVLSSEFCISSEQWSIPGSGFKPEAGWNFYFNPEVGCLTTGDVCMIRYTLWYFIFLFLWVYQTHETDHSDCLYNSNVSLETCPFCKEHDSAIHVFKI